ncbi:MAG: peptidoglycan DD-metalloendopeptidase family protein [Candidatus Zixiibacteriota bacterium]
MKLRMLLVFLMSQLTALAVNAGIKMPMMSGEQWTCSQGNNAPHYGDYDHWSEYGMAYAWDFNILGSSDINHPLVAPMDATVAECYFQCGSCTSGWGNYVILALSDGTYARMCHLEQVFVRRGELIQQGQVIGTCGTTGNSTGYHVHFQIQSTLNGSSIQTSFDDVGVPVEDQQCTSQNSNIIDLEYTANGGSTNFGTVLQDIHWYGGYETWAPDNLYDEEYNTSNTCYIRDYSGGTFSRSGIVYDALGGTRQAYTVRTGFWADGYGHGWSENDGPSGCFGMPVTNEYELGAGHARQDFQLGYLEYIQGRQPYEITIEGYGPVNDLPTYAPGWTDDGWNRQWSYLIADCYERNGARVGVGCALQKIHINWQGTSYHAQRYDFGTNGEGIIVYDPESWVDVEGWGHAGNNLAYYVYGGFYNAFSFGKVWNPAKSEYVWMPDTLGAPTSDRFSGTQYFKYGRMVDDNGITRVYNRAGTEIWNNQVGSAGGPSGDHYADIATWYDYGGTSSRIHMCLSNGGSFDFQGKYGWWMSTNYNISDVLATVSADVNGDGNDDVVNMYNYSASRRLHVFLSTGEDFDWTGSTGWWLSTSGYDPAKVVGMVSGYFNSDSYEDVAVLYAETSSRLLLHVFLSNGSSSFTKQTWWDSDGIMSYYREHIYGFTSGDYDNDGTDDICIVYYMGYRDTGEGYLTRLHMFLSTGSSFDMDGYAGWWSSPDSYEAARVHGAVSDDFNNDGIDDVTLAYYMGYRSGGEGHLTRLHFFRSTGSSFAYYQIWWNPPENYEADKILHVASGDFTGDNIPDVCMMYDSTGVRLHVFRSTGSSFAMSGGYDGWWMRTDYNPLKEIAMVAGHFNGPGGSPKVAYSEEQILPSGFSLSRNYPNPFNPTTVISFSVPEATHVRLDVYNILGQKVETLMDADQPAGEHTITWDAAKYASGVYFYRIQTAEVTETKKMLLLK